MSRKTFIKAAEIVRGMFERAARPGLDMIQETQERHLALGAREAFICLFCDDPKFDRARFLAACEFVGKEP